VVAYRVFHGMDGDYLDSRVIEHDSISTVRYFLANRETDQFGSCLERYDYQ
jgi:hypothetical protein